MLVDTVARLLPVALVVGVEARLAAALHFAQPRRVRVAEPEDADRRRAAGREDEGNSLGRRGGVRARAREGDSESPAI